MSKDITFYDVDILSGKTKLGKIAYTKKPAVLVKGLAFSEEKALNFSADEVKMRIVAPAMIPMDSYRYEDGEEFYVRFPADVIEKLRTNFMSSYDPKSTFLNEHTDISVPAYILETWIVQDPSTDKSFTEFGLEVPKGTWMMITQVTDKNYYNELVNSGKVGLSVEGLFNLVEVQLNFSQNNTQTMNELKLPDGEHTINDKIYVVKEGVITEVKDLELQEEVKEEEVVSEEIKLEEEIKEETTEEVVSEAPATSSMTEEQIIALIQPKIDELINMIAEVKASIKVEETEEEVEKPLNFSANDTFKNIVSFIKTKK